jgi:ethanolamine ammonia-lyase small subunit
MKAPGLTRSPINLRALTTARVALDRTGCSITTRHALELSLAHAQARDAVHASLAAGSLITAFRERQIKAVSVRSAASDRTEYLRRPDLGRTLDNSSATHLRLARESNDGTAITFIVADGLSALAAEHHALPLLDALFPMLSVPGAAAASQQSWRMTPIVVAEQARVALGDEIGAALDADITVMLIGERPGLSSPDSLGAYITWKPQPGRTDAERNCVSNIRTEGLGYAAAAAKIAWYITQGCRLGLTGVALRESDATLLP